MLGKRISILTFLLVFFISVFTPSVVLAKENVFSLTNAKVKEKTSFNFNCYSKTTRSGYL